MKLQGIRSGRGVAVAIVSALLIVACAAPVVQESVPGPAGSASRQPPEPVPAGDPVAGGGIGSSGSSESAGDPTDPALEEITVTGTRASGRERRTTETWHAERRRDKDRDADVESARDTDSERQNAMGQQRADAARAQYEHKRLAAEQAAATSRQLDREMQRLRAAASGAPDSADVLAGVRADEEVWVIARPEPGSAAVDPERPGSGAMMTLVSQGADLPPVRVPLPLEHTAVTASIDGYLSSVDVRQRFGNPYSQKIEAVYVFPLPEKAAVSEFVMTIGERRIRGILRDKDEARAIYAQARRQGYQASLLLQERPNMFQQKVANIEPGKTIEVDIRYFHTLAYRDGWYSFVFPTVVGPRFNPPGSPDPVVAATRGTVPGEATTVTYLAPVERSAHDISIDVSIDAGVTIEGLHSSHTITTARPAPGKARVSLAGGATLPNRDFILEFRVAGTTIRSNLMTYDDPDTGKGYFSMMLYPPAALDALPRQPMELVFVLDCSGSMRGAPLRQAKAAILAALGHLQPGDTFQVIRFSSNASQLGAGPLPATAENIAVARQFVEALNGTGGTMMIEGIKAALDFPHDPRRLRFVTFLTDGYIGNEAETIGAVHERIGAARIFSFGVGSSVNRYLMERMASEGRGAVAYLGPDDSGADIMSMFFQRISQPAITDLAIDWGDMRVSSVYPTKLPDLFVGRPVLVTGTYTGSPSAVAVSGLAGGRTRQFVVPADTDRRGMGNPNLAKIWARQRIADLANRQAWQADPQGELAASIRATALEFQLMSAYTAFVAVDATRRTDGAHGVTVQQPVPVPDGVRYETTVINQE